MNIDISLSQKEIQEILEKIYINKSGGMPKVLEYLFNWEMASGYLTEGKLKDNLRFNYLDKLLNIRFKTQINIARSNYSPKPLEGKNIPKLHCPICFENIGIPGKENLRAFSFELSPNRKFFVQMTPFPLFSHHAVLVSHEPVPMHVSVQSVIDLLNFVDQCPGYIACSNSDVEWAGASILSHHHYQVMKAVELPIFEADWAKSKSKSKSKSNGNGFNGGGLIKASLGEDLVLGFLNYPIATIKIQSQCREKLIKIAGAVIKAWKDQDIGQNTFNILVKNKNQNEHSWSVYLILRNPAYRTPAELLKYKSEGVGVIEVAGEGIYPVPKGEEAEKMMYQIEHHGLDIIKGIIAGNNPLAPENWPVQFEKFKKFFV